MEFMKIRNCCIGVGMLFVILSTTCSIIDGIQQKKGIVNFAGSLALPLGVLAILLGCRSKAASPN
jgi:hypothetical protein